MSGGRLVVLDRSGRAGKQFPLPHGLAHVGAHPHSHIRVLQRAVRPRHATVVVHHAQTVVRNVGSGETLVNGAPVSVAALRHGDVITVGDRCLRWEYADPPPARTPLPSLQTRGETRRETRRATGGGATEARGRSLELALELRHRASAPAAHGRQVAVVQPLRRSAGEQTPTGSASEDQSSSAAWSPEERRGSQTQAALWIESRKAGSPAPRRSHAAPAPSPPAPRRSNAASARSPPAARRSHAAPTRTAPAPRRSHPARRSLPAARKRTPLRLTVLRRAQSATKLVKIQPPLQIDHTKRAAIMCLTGHTPKSKLSLPQQSDKKSPSYAVKRPSPVRKTPRGRGCRSGRASDKGSDTLDLSSVTSGSRTSNRTGRRSGGHKSVTILEITDSTQDTTRGDRSAAPASPRKSALKDLSRVRSRNTDSIKFDLSNLEHEPAELATDDDVTLRYSESSGGEPDTRSRAGRMLASLGASVSVCSTDTVTAASPGARRSLRSGLLVKRALHTRPESYSVVDLVSPGSLYDSAASSGGDASYRTPRDSGARTPSRPLLACSTPYAHATPPHERPAPPGPRVSRRSRSRSRINDTMLPEDADLDDDSPKTSRRSTWRSTLGETVADETAEGGASTPENRRSPSEPGTPVLSIQSLLESSRASSRASHRASTAASTSTRRRHTTAGSAGARRAPSGARRSLRPAPASETGASRDVTPRSAAKPAPEAVKNKHSSAKRPHSRRSIIDDLDRSDVVKHLFNSPVKRKLSRSMTEFSRRRSFDEAPPRPRRRTLAVGTVRTPDVSPLNDSENYTPERFVSPIDDAALEGDESSASVAAAERPRARRSIRDDLTDVRGVKALFAASPRNRLSDVRVKEAFARSPENDLRRVSGVKALFRRSPRNELADVGGVRETFRRRSPRNDLTNVSGVKRTLRNAAPRDELSDLRGVRSLFARDRSDASHQLTGVEALFDSGDRSELLFDELVGRPPRRSVYSKTFSAAARRDSPADRSASRSLRAPTDFAPEKVEEWLRNELGKRFRASGDVSSASPAGGARELRKLATATLAGASPLLARRTRHSDTRLPFKKRSLTSSSPGPGGARRLPLKKRAVHSTPVKGRPPRALHELRRVSPIPALPPPLLDRSVRVLAEENRSAPVRVRTPRKQETPRKIDVSGRLAPEVDENVAPEPPTEIGKKVGTERKSRKSRSSLVLGKRTPAMVPKPVARETPTSPRRPRPGTSGGRARPAHDAARTPARRTRLRPDPPALLLTKPEPRLKPASVNELDKSAAKPRRGRRPAADAKPEPPTARRTRAAAPEKPSEAEPKTTKPVPSRRRKPDATSSPPPAKRGRRAEPARPEPTLPPRKVTRARRNDTDATKAAAAPAPSRTRAVKTVKNKPTKTRGKKTVTETETEKLETKSRRGGKTAARASPSPPARPRRAAPPAAPPPRYTRKRKSTAPLELPAKITKTEAKKGKKETTVMTPEDKRKRPAKGNVDSNVQTNKSTRSKRTANAKETVDKEVKPTRARKGDVDRSVQTVAKTTRSKRTADTKQTVEKQTKQTRAQKVEPKKTTTNKGKTKANVSQSPIKETAKKSTRSVAKAPTPVKRGRTAARNVVEAPTKTVGRTRRR